MKIVQIWSLILGTTFIVLNTTGCEQETQQQVKERLHIMESFGKLTPRCVGRFIVELPEKFVLNTQGGQEIEGVTLTVEPSTESAFLAKLAARASKLEKSFVQDASENYPMLRKAIALPDNSKGVVFDRAESEQQGGRLSRILELFAWRGGYTIIGTVKATDTTFPEDAKDEVIQKNLKTDVPQKLAKLTALYARVRGRADHENPETQGLCILNGFVSGAPQRGEEVNIFYHLATANDVYFQIHSSSFAAEDDTILDRLDTIAPMIAEDNGKVLRKGARNVNDVKGNEIAYTELGDQDVDGNKVMMHHFIFEANSRQGSAQLPILTVDLINGRNKPVAEGEQKAGAPSLPKATLSERDVNNLWDTTITSVRKNPRAF